MVRVMSKVQSLITKDQCPITNEIRNPKAEIRKKAEIRNPKVRSAILLGEYKDKRAGADRIVRFEMLSDFGFRASGFFRISAFGFRISNLGPWPLDFGLWTLDFSCLPFAGAV